MIYAYTYTINRYVTKAGKAVASDRINRPIVFSQVVYVNQKDSPTVTKTNRSR